MEEKKEEKRIKNEKIGAAGKSNLPKKPKKNIHAGHRGRLLELIQNCGLENLSEIQAMEFFLTYVFPRGDTNPLAHRLLDEFQTFSNVLEAEPSDLMCVEGINKRSASMIASFKELFFYFFSCRLGKKCKISNLPELLDIVEDTLRFRTTEFCLFLGISPSDYVIRKKVLGNKNAGKVSLDAHEVNKFISDCQPAAIVVAHNHPYGKAFESQKDVEAFKQVNLVCSSCGVKLVDSFIVGEDGIFSQMKEGFVRNVHDVEEISDAFKSYLD